MKSIRKWMTMGLAVVLAGTMLKDPVMWSTLWNTLRYVLVIVPFTLALSILIAALLNTDIKGRSVFRVIYFIPTITMSTGAAMPSGSEAIEVCEIFEQFLDI